MTDKFSVSPTFLMANTPLVPRDAVAAIIVDPEGKLLLQLRDDKEHIFFPNHWGCFGGAIDPGETPEQTLIRELTEEIGITCDAAMIETFITITFTTKADGPLISRYFFLVHMQPQAMKAIRLGEGSDFDLFSVERVLSLANVTPYDRFAIWLYTNGHRLQQPD